jgi:OmcA/MtrC family decaheme c-type cytochrome
MNDKIRGRWLGRCTSVLLAGLLAGFLAGCGGGGGGDSTEPTPPPVVDNTPPVEVPKGTSPITLTANTPAATFAALAPKVNVGRVTISGGAPKVDFSITDTDGNAIIGFGSTSKSATATVASYANLSFSLAKLVPGSNGSPSKWVSYIVTTVPTTTAAAAPTRPSTDNTGTLVDNKNGTYSYTFYRDVTKVKDQVAAMTVTGANNKADLGDLTFDPNLTHRLTIQVSGNAPGTGTNTANAVQTIPGVPMRNPVDVIYDFVPATGKAVTASDPNRVIAATSKCNDCHQQLGGIPGGNPESSAAGFHGGSRNEVRYCVVCHTEQRKYGRTEAKLDATTNAFTETSTYMVDGRAVGNLPNFIHKIHLGVFLAKKNYNYAGVVPNEVGYPQDIRNCTKCHDGSDSSTAKTAQGDNWKNVPSKLACGSCHDGINFETGRGVTLADAERGLTTSPFGHVGGAQADDSLCVLCHKPANVDVNHLPVTPPNFASALHVAGGNANTNSAWIASNTSRLPAGAIKVSYDIKSVTRNADKKPVMVFRMLQNGQRKDLNPTTAAEIWDGFMGAPSVYFVFSVPQDGIAAPADFNATASSYLRSLWKGTATGTSAGTLTGPDADGYYTATITGSTIPDNAVMLTGGVGYSYNVTSTLPLTQTNLADYPVSPSPIAHASGNKVGGLIVVSPNVQKVAAGYTGRRPIVEDARCNKCHQELGAFTAEAFHGGQRNDGTTCSWCHTPNRASSGWSADSTSFVHAIHAGAKRTVKFNWHAISATEGFWDIGYPGVLAQCEGCHLPGTYDFSAATSAAALPNRQYRTVASGTLASTGSTFAYSPYITMDQNYGAGFSFNAGTGVTTQAAGTTLVDSPIANACFGCHDSAAATAHIRSAGTGSIYAPRSTALASAEQCMLCHGPGKVAAISAMHAK